MRRNGDSEERCSWTTYDAYAEFGEPLWTSCPRRISTYTRGKELGLCTIHLEEWEEEEKFSRIRRRYNQDMPRYMMNRDAMRRRRRRPDARRNPDSDIRHLEREFASQGTQDLAEQLMIAYQRAGRELDFLTLLDQRGPELREHGSYVTGPSGYQKFHIPSLSPEQEQRLYQLSWESFRQRAKQADDREKLDVGLLKEVEALLQRRIFFVWDTTVWVLTHEPHHNQEALDHIYHTIDDEYTASLYCSDDDESLELYPSPQDSRNYWLAYYNSPEAESTLTWHLNRGEDPRLENFNQTWHQEGSNTAAINWLYDHRECSRDPYVDDPQGPWNEPPPDTPSLPPVGSQDPNW